MYFDFAYYARVLQHVWCLKDWPGRTRMLVRLLMWIPLLTLFHGLCFILDYVFFPRLWFQRVDRPVFIVGHARSGTTLCHRLLAADGDNFSYFLYWEVLFPSLLQKKIIRGLGKLDRALGEPCKRRLKIWDDKTFGKFRHIHNMSLWNAEEDQFVMRAAFVTQQWALDVPMMDKIDLYHVDQMSAKKRQRWMHHYRECVKRQLLLNGGKRIHLSKNPLMCGWVGAIIEAFPDARIVVMMRNPNDCIPSTLKLLELSWQGKGWRPEQYASSLREMVVIAFDSMRHPREVLDAHPETLQAFVDYRDITTEPRQTVHQLYESLAIAVSESFDAWLRSHQEKERGHKTHFEYTIKAYELSHDQIEAELGDLFDEYQWPRLSDANGPQAMEKINE